MGKQKDNLTKKSILFTAHPDDNLCVAGTLMFLKDKGFKVYEVIATGGERGPWFVSKTKRKKKFKEEELKEVRKKEISKASKIIGIDKTMFLGLPDSQVSWNFEVIREVIRIIRQEKPVIVFLNNPYDYHSDHRDFSKMVKEAIERSAWNFESELGDPWRVPIVLYFEGIYFGKSHILVDISKYWQRKQKAIDTYASQIYLNERKLLEGMNYYRNYFLRDHKSIAAEAFEIPEELPIKFNLLTEIFS